MWYEVAASVGNKKTLRSELRECTVSTTTLAWGASWQCNMAPPQKVDMCVWPFSHATSERTL